MIKMRLMQIYSDREGSRTVSQAGARLRAEAGAKKCAETAWNTELWRNAKLRMIAAREAAEADIILIAAREGARLAPDVRQWLQLWRNRKRTKRATLVAFLQRDRCQTPRTVERALHSFARSVKMGFLCHSKVEMAVERSAPTLDLSLLV